ncbi:uncharacterized protein [Muntiacus reevesi]|uniref:uncharacterized protein isoform X2 n=1 Tax=Muntiacus reevesi TaxID=9886 RepID=UPI003306D332
MGNCGTPQICSEVETWSPGPTSERSEVTCASWGPCRWPRRPSPPGPRCSLSPMLPGPAQLLAPVSGSMSEAPRRWSRATPPAHGAVDGGVTAETPEVTVPGSWGQGAGPPGLPPRRFYPKPGAGQLAGHHRKPAKSTARGGQPWKRNRPVSQPVVPTL